MSNYKMIKDEIENVFAGLYLEDFVETPYHIEVTVKDLSGNIATFTVYNMGMNNESVRESTSNSLSSLTGDGTLKGYKAR